MGRQRVTIRPDEDHEIPTVRTQLPPRTLGGGAGGQTACTSPPRPPNIPLITLDTTRRDHCSVYGYERGTTPNLRRLAERGTLFDLAYAPTATTGPTHASIFTSLHPITHRVVKNGLPLACFHVTLAERLQERGYATGGVVSSFVLDAKFGYAQGFDVWDDDFDRAGATLRVDRWEDHDVDSGFDRRADVTTRRALGWLEHRRETERPFFLFVHCFDPHEPYTPPPEFAERFAPAAGVKDDLQAEIARYDAEIAFTDDQVGRLLAAVDRLGLVDDTLVAVVGDHGEGLMQHGHMAHGVHIYEEQVRVPLPLLWPGRIEAGRIVGAPVQLVDLAPTLLDLAGERKPGGVAGDRSLTPLLRAGDTPRTERPVYLYRIFPLGDDACPRLE